ncbi:hypothetical protein [Pedobacter helvus]|uniref:Uncharacterized protein n=1 Tax=Pedobacter helvus TaxID=2563444 RepID=A0ABW9JLY4_9SPHI|nr:hypothetical protein [Pedobacter ureilyticus]
MIFSSIRKGNEIYDFRSTILDYFEEQIQCLSLSKVLLSALLHRKHTGLPLRARSYQVYLTKCFANNEQQKHLSQPKSKNKTKLK